jgi:hypothetical protein
MMNDAVKDWLVWDAKGRLWWKPDGKGYTRRIAEAGRFTEAEAIRHQMSSDLTTSGDRHDVAIPLAAMGLEDAVAVSRVDADAMRFMLTRAVYQPDPASSEADLAAGRAILDRLDAALDEVERKS